MSVFTVYELLECICCEDETVRPVKDELYPPCKTCGCEDMRVFDLVPVLRHHDEGYRPILSGLGERVGEALRLIDEAVAS